MSEFATLTKAFEEYRSKLLAMVRLRMDPALGARIDADDILNEAYLVAQRRWPEQRPSGLTPFAWLYRIVRDCLIEAWRRETRGKRDLRQEMPWPEQSSVQLGMKLVATATSPSEAMAREDLKQRMQEALKLLSDNDREILWMRHYDQLAFKEAALILGISEDAAMQRYARALQRLTKLWQKLFPQGDSEP